MKSFSWIIALLFLFYVKPLSYFVPKSFFYDKSSSKAIYSSDGVLLKLTLSKDEKYRLWIPLHKISPDLVQKTLLKEDRYFFYHPGINPFSTIRAIFLTLFTEKRYGGSTITMQLARLRHHLKTKRVSGKLKQILFALVYELFFTKEQILEAYLNLAPYGGNIEGVGAASLIYFRKLPSNLNSNESSALVLIPQSPSTRALDIRSGEMQVNNLLTQVNPNSSVFVKSSRGLLPNYAPHFCNFITQRFETSIVRTSLNFELQRMVERKISEYVKRNEKFGIKNASVLLVEIPSMAVRSYVGSADFFNIDIHGQVDGLRAKRSPGSALKPFLYALALDNGLILPTSVLPDTPFSKANYTPDNFDYEFLGPIKAVDALNKSRNAPAVYLLNQLGVDVFYTFLEKAKISKLRDRDFYGLSLILGGVEVSSLELAKLYAILVNDGYYKELKYLENLEIKENSAVNLISRESAFLTYKMLSMNPAPNDSPYLNNHTEIAWKTGTSFGFKDAWAIGIFGNFVLSVWVGNFNGLPNPLLIGREIAGPLFFEIAESVIKSRFFRHFNRSFANYPAIRKIKVCPISGQLHTPNCGHASDGHLILGKSLITKCSVHRSVAVDTVAGKRVCNKLASRTSTQIFEFWPSHILTTFKYSATNRLSPPEWANECSQFMDNGFPVQIVSPDPSVNYILTKKNNSIPLYASFDSESKQIFWFANQTFLGAQDHLKPLLWQPVSGEYLLTAVDEKGRGESVKIKISWGG